MSSPSDSKLITLAGKFTLVGMLNSGVGFFVIFALMLLGVDPYLSNAAGYCFGLTVSFLLHRGWVFRSSSGLTSEVAKYAVAVVVAYLLNIGCLAILIRAGSWPYLAQGAAAVIYTVAMFLFSTYWVFPRASHD